MKETNQSTVKNHKIYQHFFRGMFVISLLFIVLFTGSWYYSLYNHYQSETKRLETEIITPYLERIQKILPREKKLVSELKPLLQRTRNHLKNEFYLNSLISLPVVLLLLLFAFYFSYRSAKPLHKDLSLFKKYTASWNPQQFPEAELKNLYFQEFRQWLESWNRLIYEKKRTVMLLKAAEEKVNLLHYAGELVAWSMDHKFKILSFNQGFEILFKKQFGERQQLHPGMNFLDAIANREEKMQWKQRIEQAFQEKSLRQEIVLDNRLYYLEIQTATREKHHIYITGWEITRERQQDAKIIERENRLAAVLQSSPLTMILIGLDATILMASPLAMTKTGYGEQLRGKDFTEIITPTTSFSWEETLSELLDSDNKQILCQVEIQTAKQQSFKAIAHLCFWQDSNQNPVGIIAFVEDMSEREKGQNELQKAQLRLASHRESLSRTVQNMYSEVHSILTTIQSIVHSENHDKGQLRQSLQQIDSLAGSCLQFLDMLPGEEILPGIPEEQTPIQPAVLIREVKNLLSREWQEQDQDFELLIEPSIPQTIIFSEEKLRQFLLNLGRYSLKTFTQGHIKWTCYAERVQSSQVMTYLYIRCTYTTERLDTLDFFLENLQLAVNRKKHNGPANLAYLIARLGQAMQADFFFERGGQKATILITLPGVETIDQKQTGNSIAWNSIRFKKSIILLADDLDLNRKLIKEYLAGGQLNIIEAKNGRQALSYAEKHLPDLILMDMRMPKISGVDAAQKIKENHYLKHIPIVLLISAEMGRTSITEWADGHLQKPVQQKELILELVRFLPYEQSCCTSTKTGHFVVENKVDF